MTVIQDPTQKCDFKEKFRKLWNRAFSSIRTINGKGTEDAEGSVTLTAEDIPDVQPLLTAGENITIEDNVISATGGGSAPVWGNITGTLEDQTDLKNALDGKASIYDTYTKDETDVLISYKADVASVESIEDEIGAVGQAGTIRNDISLVNDRVDSVEDEIGPETTAGTLRYKIKENANDIISIENEIDIIDGIIAAHSTAINDKADKTYVDAHISDTSNPHMVSKAQVGLSNVDNTSDANKPISTATQNALNGKANNFADPAFYRSFGSLRWDSGGHIKGMLNATRQYLPSGRSFLTINISCQCTAGLASEFTFMSPTTLLSILGITANIISVGDAPWQEFGSSGQMDRTITGNGTSTLTDVGGNWVQLTRAYNEQGTLGGIPLSNFSGKIIEITNYKILLDR